MSTNAPCIKCIERNPCCHSECEKYFEYCKMLQAIHTAKKQEYDSKEDYVKVRFKKWRTEND